MIPTAATAGRRAIWVCAVGLVAVACARGLAADPVQAPQAGAPVSPAASPCDLTAPGRIVAIGDVHGAFDRFTAILRESGVIDRGGRWVGGNATLVQVGDLVDRGDDSRKVLDLVRQLERDAPAAGGQVRFVLGNHEVMRMAGDMRYTTQGEYDAFKSADAAKLRDQLYDQMRKEAEAAARAKREKFNAGDYRKAFLDKTPLGAVEMQRAFAESGEYGRWLRAHDLMVRINGIAFGHTAPAPSFAARGCAGINADAKVEMKKLDLADPDILNRLLWSPDGPLWHRGLVGVAPAATSEDVTTVLAALGASRIVVGHTVTSPGHIKLFHDGRVIAIDAGMRGGSYFPGGKAAALEIQGGTFTAIYEGTREVLISPGGSGSARR